MYLYEKLKALNVLGKRQNQLAVEYFKAKEKIVFTLDL